MRCWRCAHARQIDRVLALSTCALRTCERTVCDIAGVVEAVEPAARETVIAVGTTSVRALETASRVVAPYERRRHLVPDPG